MVKIRPIMGLKLWNLVMLRVLHLVKIRPIMGLKFSNEGRKFTIKWS